MRLGSKLGSMDTIIGKMNSPYEPCETIPPRQWSFPYLNSFSPWFLNLPTCTTIAYWLGIFKGTDVQIELPLGYTWHELMSLQIDLEGQATSKVDLLAMPEIMPDPFQPFSPVAFARAWSPIPLLCDRFGEPTYSALGKAGKALVFWSSVSDWKPLEHAKADVSHFESILRTTHREACKVGAGLLIIASPGWSYEADDLKGARSVHRLMKSIGYEVVTRTPDER